MNRANKKRPKIEAIEIVRHKAGLSRSLMHRVLGVSKPAYYAWIKGAEIQRNTDDINLKCRILIHAIHDGYLPFEEGLNQFTQLERVQKIINFYLER